jgi:spore maturation protein CgeB
VRVVLFCHSLLSDWNHGNAHFLRGVVVELQSRGHQVHAFEPGDAWSACNLTADHGADALAATTRAYPSLRITRYDAALDLDAALDDADVVLVHEWNRPDLVARIGAHRRSTRRHLLLFHDTHHRSVSDPDGMRTYDLSGYDGVLAFGAAIREQYLARGWASRVWTWHEAADVRRFRPLPERRREGQLIWIGNWGDGERAEELSEFLLEPARRLQMRTVIHGVRYPADALDRLRAAGVEFRGWLPNYHVPEAFARHRVTVHVPRRLYASVLPGIPTIRPFEALACGIPLVSAPWRDDERLFRPGVDYLKAPDGAGMCRHLRDIINDDALAASLVEHGRETILARHTCGHRVDELLAIVRTLRQEMRQETGHETDARTVLEAAG